MEWPSDVFPFEDDRDAHTSAWMDGLDDEDPEDEFEDEDAQAEREVLSVSPKRIDGLQPRATALKTCARISFQYPQSGSMGCSGGPGEERAVLRGDFQYPQSGSMGCSPRARGAPRPARRLSVSPKRIDGLQPIVG